MSRELKESTRAFLLEMQRGELTESRIYSNIAAFVKKDEDRRVLETIASEELGHASVWKEITGDEAVPDASKIRKYTWIARILGYTFAIKLMENGESSAQNKYDSIVDEVPESAAIREDEKRHEAELISLLDEERLRYVGSMVLGLSDALVELTGTIAGLTFALQSTKLIALSGLITGISATLSMASSEYLSAKSEGRDDALKSCTYTGIAYCITVALMILPFLLLGDAYYLPALLIMLVTVILEIAAFSYYISVVQEEPFRNRFGEMAGISMGVAVIAFVIGLLAKRFLGVEI